jgi:hypothetical protein
MSLSRKSTNILSSKDKVIHYLQNSTNNCLNMLENTSTNNNLFSIQQHRLRCCSENDSLSSSSSSSIVDSLSRSDFSAESSLSDPIAHCSIISSNISSDEDLDFNIGFDQITDDEDDQHILNKNNAGMFPIYIYIFEFLVLFFLDAVTLLGESTLDARINEFEEYFRESSNSTIFNDEYDFNNDDTIKTIPIKQQRRASFLHDSTYTLCSQDRFSAYTEDDQENEQINGFVLRSNSLSILQLDGKSTFVEKASKKVVRFADMLVCH